MDSADRHFEQAGLTQISMSSLQRLGRAEAQDRIEQVREAVA
jgi:hypothetical protein